MNSLNRKVPIKNVLYMYSYIWNEAQFFDFTDLNCKDDFDSINILSELFIINMHNIIKRGFYKEYINNVDEIRGIKGKILIKDSIKNLQFHKSSLICEYDEFSENNLINQILRTTAFKLYRTDGLNDINKKRINNILSYYNKVSIIDIDKHTFEIKFNKNNKYMLNIIRICELINNSLMLSEDNGKYRFINVLDDDKKMQAIFEMFICKFYDIELHSIYNVKGQQRLNWNLLDGKQEILPEMRMDTVLEGKCNNKIIIIDTKYYPDFMKQGYYSGDDKKSLISGNLYQMNAYMNNINTQKELLGMLLYPMPYNENEISEKYSIDVVSNGQVKKAILQIQTVNLSNDWRMIKKELLEIVNN